ncbi:ABC transporter substrate-binding protein [Conexibacter woesei]|uniref:Extracellular solute-binding protein family 5 n=1 Tax=Conexibacter woesei (strain DSM 14684 / CCUG 47730 / CIP 108061 / JCM 11494 / NBRC 100937 / ID131577) TaxID=469383 RepID=D3F859_CONWI|nr:ABC transporter substrate-binding protein [Conexibacter woesei]ADB48929.1 extracellular solute-binding protein family 5 [Conexibacter woesei DSM 14684]
MDEVKKVLPSVRGRGVSRRAFLNEGAAWGLSASTVGRLLAVGAAPAGLLAGCGTDSESASGGGGGGGAAGIIAIGNAEPPTSAYWDPHAQFGMADTQLWSLTYDMLLSYDKSGRVVGGLARRWHRTSPQRMRLELREDARFQDGAPVLAKDVKASLDRLGDPESRLVLSAYATPGMRVEVIDEHTIEIVTPRPFGPLESALTLFAIAPARDIAQPDVFRERPLGSGPFRFVRYKNNVVELVANERYWRGKPASRGVELRYIADPEARLNALLTGAIDIYTRGSSLTLDATKKDGYHVTTTGPASQLIYIPQHNTELSDPRVRQAIAHAIDRRAIAKSLIRIDPPARSSLPAGTDGFRPLAPSFEYDPDKARRLLADAGHANGLKITMASSNLVTHQPAIDQLVKSWLEEVGIEVELRTLETGTFRSSYNQYALSFNALGTMNPDPDSLLTFFRPVVAQAALNLDDPKIGRLLQRTRETTGAARRAAIDAYASYLWQNQIMIYVTDDIWFTVVNPKLRNYHRTPQQGEPLLWRASKA